MPKPDWTAIKAEYITTSVGYRPLAEKWEVSFRTLSDRGKREGWPAEREKYRNGLVTRTVQKVSTRTSTDHAEKLSRLQVAADRMSEVLEQLFADTEQFKRHIITEGSGKGATSVECKTFDKLDTKAIKDITSALKDMAYIVRNIYGLPTVQEQEAMEIAARRMLLEERKADAGMLDDDDTGIIEISAVQEEPEDEQA